MFHYQRKYSVYWPCGEIEVRTHPLYTDTIFRDGFITYRGMRIIFRFKKRNEMSKNDNFLMMKIMDCC